MAKTPSQMVALGTPAPDFTLPDTVSGKSVSLADFKGSKALVVMFICNHCPFVLHINPKLVEVARAYQARGVAFVGISSNSVESHPQDGPEKMTETAAAVGYTFPYLYDETQEVAKAFNAACTPDIFVYDSNMQLIYRGQFDASRPGNGIEVTGQDLTDALDAILQGEPVSQEQRPSIGCNIKWK